MDDMDGWDIGEVQEASDKSLQLSDSNDLPTRGLERESSMHLSEVFNTPTPAAAAAAESLGAETTATTTAGTARGLKNWLERKLKDQEDNDNNGGHHSSQNSASFRSFSESESQLGGGNFVPVGGGYIPKAPV
jgi:hypothetical protein